MITNDSYQLEASLNRTEISRWEYHVKVTDINGDYVETSDQCTTMDVAAAQMSYSLMMCLNEARGIEHAQTNA